MACCLRLKTQMPRNRRQTASASAQTNLKRRSRSEKRTAARRTRLQRRQRRLRRRLRRASNPERPRPMLLVQRKILTLRSEHYTPSVPQRRAFHSRLTSSEDKKSTLLRRTRSGNEEPHHCIEPEGAMAALFMCIFGRYTGF